jgi:proteasome assembly chaperone (PAC2) family protein
MFNRFKQDGDNIIWLEKPSLTHPEMIIGFEGWPDAGKVSSGVVSYLSNKLSPVLFAKLKPNDFYTIPSHFGEFQRPQVVVEKGMVKSLEMATTSFGYVKGLQNRRDLILVYGPEPDQSWDKYARIIMNIAQMYKIDKIVALGGTFDAIPHTLVKRITASVSQPDLQDFISSKEIELVEYKGPASIHTLLIMTASRLKIPMINLWGHTPHYIQVPNTMGCYDLLSKLNSVLDMQIDLEEARAAGEQLNAQIDRAMAIKPELRKYLDILETNYRKESSSHQQPINQNIVKEIEKLLNDKLS